MVEYWFILWDDRSAEPLGVKPGLPRFQTFWELTTLVLTLVTWGPRFINSSLAVLGDNTGALQTALSLKGRMPNLGAARELAWRQARGRWSYEVGHLPSEHNVTADALSRVTCPEPAQWPAADLGSASWRNPPSLEGFWRSIPQPGRSAA